MSDAQKAVALHLGFLGLIAALGFILPPCHHGNMARILVLATYAMGYNLLFGYAGLLSLGHAMFFAAGLYGAALTIEHLSWGVGTALAAGLVSGAGLALLVGSLALRTLGVAFMIVTLMFSQAVYLAILFFGDWTRGDEGFVIRNRVLLGFELSEPGPRFTAAFILFAIALLSFIIIVQSRFGRVLIAIRENEDRTRMLGYNTFAHKLFAVVASGLFSAASGASYGILFGYAGASFAGVQYSILPLLWVLLGGAGTTIGPFIGTFFAFYLIDIASGLTNAYMLVVGVVLILITLFARQGIGGEIRTRLWGWLP
ncbi:MAG: branched-chain amino acid ABC transporter permease [Pseudomonadota bacterium]